jgi:hypothetical protein
MSDLERRLERLETTLGAGRCTCWRNDQGQRFYACQVHARLPSGETDVPINSSILAELTRIEASWSQCRATHATNDQSLVVRIRSFTLPAGYESPPTEHIAGNSSADNAQ